MSSTPARLELVPCPLCGSESFTTLLRSHAQMTARQQVFRFVRCRSCRLVYLNPRVASEDIGMFYGIDYPPHRGAEAWGRFAPFVKLGQKRVDGWRARQTLRFANLHTGSRVLDVGCGKPSFLQELHRIRRSKCVGLDVSGAGWLSDPKRFRGIELHQGTLHDTPIEPGFDAITMWHAIEHEPRPVDALRRLRDLASKQAALLVETPNFDSVTSRLHGHRWAGLHTPRHTAIFTPSTLTRLMESTGWRVEHMQTWGSLDAYLLFWLGRQDARGTLQGGSLQKLFLPFLAGKIAATPLRWVERFTSLGLLFAVARPA